MYISAAFRIEDKLKLASFIQEHPFAMLITHDGAAPFASHLPMLLRQEDGVHGMLFSHMARANSQWKHFHSGAEVLAIFHGPHAYISPAWYEATPAVPTWNYAAVHVYGIPKMIEDHHRIVSLLGETVSAFDATGNDQIPAEYRDKMIQGIVAFELCITRIEGKFKLNQNRSVEDSLGVIKHLSASPDQEDQRVAELMRQECGPFTA